MTDEPATTSTCGKCGSDLPERGCCPCIGLTPAADRDEAHQAFTIARRAFNDMRAERDQARAQVVACQAAADDLRARVAEAMSTWLPIHDVGACQDFACKDCVVEACRDDITNALEDS